jgi:hypothetical protein
MTYERPIHFKTANAGRKRMQNGPAPSAPAPSPERIPRISRLMALAIHFDGMIRRGEVRDYADLARLGGITRARATQIMHLLNLAPEIQEKLLFLLGTTQGRDEIAERNLRSVVARTLWTEQRNTYEILPQLKTGTTKERGR